MNQRTRDVIVIGGGISGLTVAWHLQRAEVDVALIEAGEGVGGCMRTEQRDGFLLEKGPFNVIVRDPAFEELLAGLSERITVVTASDAARKRYLYRQGRLMAVPTNPVSLLTSPLLSFGGACRAIRGLFLSRRGDQAACTIEEFATRRFGREVSDTMVSAVVAGILAGDIRRLSAYACFPVLRDFDAKSFSPLGRTARRIPNIIRKRWNPALRRRWRGLVSIDRGLGGLADAIADTLGDRLVTGCRVDAINHDTDGYTLECRQSGGRNAEYLCRRLVLAAPAGETSRLLGPIIPQAGEILDGIESASLTVINMAFRRSEVGHPLDGFGFLVPHNEPEFPLMGVLWADSAFPHHAPADQRLIRVFVGGARTPDVIARSSDELVTVSFDALRDLLQISGDPTLIDVCPYAAAIPQFYLGHEERIARLRRYVADVPGLHLAGNYLDGVSINDCVRLAKQVAHEIVRGEDSKPDNGAASANEGNERKNNDPSNTVASSRAAAAETAA
jgi:oxygen-dependent protoporphyrinogen oxidase